MPVSRDERILGSASQRHQPSFVERRHDYECVRCAATVDGVNLFCPDHMLVELRP
jgi:hypothetical protein